VLKKLSMSAPVKFAAVVAAALALADVRPWAQSRQSLSVAVTETAGIRRAAYPTLARVRFDRGTLADAAHVRLMSNGMEVPGQFGAEASYPDGSVQWLTVDFNASLGPHETANYQLEYGAQIEHRESARGLTVSQDGEGIQIGSVRLGLTGAPLIVSVKYRREDIASGLNGFSIVDIAGTPHDAASAEQRKVEVIKPGPLSAVVRYSGQLPLAGQYAVGYATTVEMPNSKSWMKITTAIADPEKRVREIAFHTPLALGAQPWTWDFGTGSWSYGLLRSRAESAALFQFVGPSTRWEIRSGPKGQELVVESRGGRRPNLAEGWGHLQDQSEAVAFAIPDFGAEAGVYSCTLDGDGQLSYRWAPARPLPHLQLTVYEHFVATPVPVGAVTSPVSMLNPLVVSVSNPR
jgi:YetA-like protein